MGEYINNSMNFNYDILKNGSRAFIIDKEGKDHPIDILSIDYYIAEANLTVKVEGMEKVYHQYYPSTVHVFISPAGAPSFDSHQDPCDVEIHCVSGTKTMVIDGKDVILKAGDFVKIPANTWHHATNEYDSIMLSVGYE